ncbi:MAG: pseudouridine synthase [Rhodocyclaceae bacterium]|jgi:16S rRNA pseudouridine516 synthase|nr:pseudouridine synthase [Rhodocyclaceae bacterium]MCE2724652.1 pseudouridine synthase [Betaproteobacteria bacterium]MCA3030279.1 pseudouridine synthase [Rhodocyclaceae bacterium]MCA3044016.1 pseudouridine synthase [Rhodocyclaceae bacterium]MCA3054916.1 pseudouridine synthase [Rhodocyclaceae bacterium]
MTLEQLLFSQGFGTRKMCRLLIADGHLAIGGETQTNPAQHAPQVAGGTFTFSVRGQLWQYHAKAYLALNKPSGYECSQKSKAHPSVYTLLPSPLRTRDVQSVGRLDQDTTGLLLFSDDGQFIHKMASPKHHVPKIYEVTTSEELTDKQVTQLLAGVVLEDSPVPVIALACERLAPTHLKMTLAQGKYHQVKRMLSAVGNHVRALHRSQIGQLALPPDLALGEWRFLTPNELAMVCRA